MKKMTPEVYAARKQRRPHMTDETRKMIEGLPPLLPGQARWIESNEALKKVGLCWSRDFLQAMVEKELQAFYGGQSGAFAGITPRPVPRADSTVVTPTTSYPSGGLGPPLRGPGPPKPDPVEAEPPDEEVEVSRLEMVGSHRRMFCRVCSTLMEVDAVRVPGQTLSACPNCGVPNTKKMKVAKYIRNRKP